MNNNIQTPDPSAQLQMIQESFTNHTVLGFDKAEVKDQARSFHAFGDVKYVKADHYESGPLIYLRMANFVSNHQDKLNAAELKELTQVLDKQIEEIHADTSGIGGFFRYLFSPRAKAEKNNQKAYLESLKTIVDNILEAQQKKSAENEIDHHPDAALLKEEPIDSENVQTELKLAQPLDLAQSIAFFPMKSFSETTSQPFLSDLPQESLSQSLPPSFFQSKEKGSLPPPIPFAPRLGARIQPKLFACEPQQPLFLKIANDKMPLEQLQKEIKEIEAYLKGAEKALAPIRFILDEVAKKEEHLKGIRQDLKKERQDLTARRLSLKALKESGKDEIAYLYITKKGGKDKMPYFPDKLFEAINTKRQEAWEQIKARHAEKIKIPREQALETNRQIEEENKQLAKRREPLKPLVLVPGELQDSSKPEKLRLIPLQLKKTEAMEHLLVLEKKAEEAVSKSEQEVQALEKEIEALKKTENNQLKFNEFEALVTKKTTEQQGWIRALNNRQNLLKAPVKRSTVEKIREETVSSPEESPPLPGEADLSNLSMEVQAQLRRAGSNSAIFYESQTGQAVD